MNSFKISLSQKTVLVLGLISVFTIVGCKKDIQQTPVQEESMAASPLSAQAEAQPGTNYVPNQLLVKFKKGLSTDARTAALLRIGGTVSEKILTKTMERLGDNEGIYLIHTPLAVFEAVGKIKGDDIEFAEPNYIYTHYVEPTDNYYANGSLWGMYGNATTPANQYGSQAGEAWAAGNTGSSNTALVGIIDEGVMWSHPDLDANCWINTADPVNGADDDGNGYVDDNRGWDFDGNNNSTFDGLTDDHGTHVAGTIGAERNGTGVVGVNYNVKIISAKFLGRNGGTTANAIKAVDYITDLKTRHGLNIVATNNSWGGGGFSQLLKDAIDRANAKDILFVAAAGNSSSNNDATASYPSNYTSANVIGVASITSSGALSSFSSYGATTVDIGAPGSGINSTLPVRSGGNVVAGYGSYSGTSMATPHVTGGAALYASSHPGATAAAIKNAILSSAVATTSLNGKCVTGGRLNVSGF